MNNKKELTARDLALFLGCPVETPHGRGRLYRVDDSPVCGVILDGRETDYFRDVNCAEVRPLEGGRIAFAALNHLSAAAHAVAAGKGFYDERRNFGEILMLVVSELGEAMEAHRKGRHSQIEPGRDYDPEVFAAEIKDTMEDELADTFIRLLDLCGYLGIDIAAHVEQKMKYNQTRERLHGKKY